MAGTRTIEVTRKDGSTHVVEGVDRVDMKDTLIAYRGEQVLYMIIAGEWESWKVLTDITVTYDGEQTA